MAVLLCAQPQSYYILKMPHMTSTHTALTLTLAMRRRECRSRCNAVALTVVEGQRVNCTTMVMLLETQVPLLLVRG